MKQTSVGTKPRLNMSSESFNHGGITNSITGHGVNGYA